MWGAARCMGLSSSADTPKRLLSALVLSAPAWPRRRGTWLALVAALAIAVASPTPALTASEASQPSKPTVIKPIPSGQVTPQVFEGDVRDLPKAKRWKPGDPVREGPPLMVLPPAQKESEPSPTSKTVVTPGGQKIELREGPGFKGDVRDLPKAKRWKPGDPVREGPPLMDRPPPKKEEIPLQAEEARASSPHQREGGSYGCQ